jgi:hypothetical protein
MQMNSSKLEHAYARGVERVTVLKGVEGGGAIQYLRDAVRCLATMLGWPTQKVIDDVRTYHKERLDAVPDLARYPELRGYRDLLLEQYRAMTDAGIDEDTIALAETLLFWRDTRLLQQTGKAWHAVVTPEKCRVLYAPESDEGAIHAKNIDDPLTYWKPRPPYPKDAKWPWTHPLRFDGVGSGLHMDEIPPEIFPVNPHELCNEHCTTVNAATEFMVRYNYFWSSQNLLVHDMHGNSMVFEKTRCRVATRKPNSKGINFITGMGALDPQIREFQTQQREKYLKQIGSDWNGMDGCFWKVCQGKWDNMARYVDELSKNPTVAGVKELMEKRDSSGPMCLTGKKSHPDDKITGCTLVMDIWLMDKKKLHRRQWRGETPAYLDAPEIVQFN